MNKKQIAEIEKLIDFDAGHQLQRSKRFLLNDTLKEARLVNEFDRRISLDMLFIRWS